MKTAKFTYKCRLCGKLDSNPCTSVDNALIVLSGIIQGYDMPKSLIGKPPKMMTLHPTCEVGVGIMDLIGFIEE